MTAQKRWSKRQGYETGIHWIALNDEPGDRDLEAITYYISTLLLADVFGIEPERVAADILKVRNQQGSS